MIFSEQIIAIFDFFYMKHLRDRSVFSGSGFLHIYFDSFSFNVKNETKISRNKSNKHKFLKPVWCLKNNIPVGARLGIPKVKTNWEKSVEC